MTQLHILQLAKWACLFTLVNIAFEQSSGNQFGTLVADVREGQVQSDEERARGNYLLHCVLR